MIALVDYGAGNLTSVRKALAALGAEFVTPADPGQLEQVQGIIVPGVGHFDATRALDGTWRTAIRAAVDRGAALFGICLGMQWLFEGSAESPGAPGLGLLAGTCQRLPDECGQSIHSGLTPLWKVPHVGWNSLEVTRAGGLMAGVEAGAHVYFTHSYIAPVVAATAAITTYGVPFSAAVQSGRVAGVQFHPEKSGEVGLHILSNWLDAD